MPEIEKGANEITMSEIEAFLNSDGTDTPPVEDKEGTPPATQPNPEQKPAVTETQAFAHRLKEATNKAREEERNNIAKGLGYKDYAEMQKSKEADILKAKGLDPDEVSPVVEELLKKRLEEDPRLKELEDFRQQKIKDWAEKELVELKTLTSGKISKMEDIPKEVIELWKTGKKGSLKAAYLELEGEKLIREMQAGIASEHSKGSTNHLLNPQGSSKVGLENKRPMTAKEKEIFKIFNPDATEEQMSKILKNK